MSRAARVPVSAPVLSLLRSKAGVALDLGCGHRKQPHFIGIDARPLPGVDLVHDLQQTPWPLPDSCAHSVVMYHLFEHLLPWKVFPFMAELHRVCRHGAQVFISGPYALDTRFVQDPTHVRPVNEGTFAYFDPLHIVLYEVYEPPPFHFKVFTRIPVEGGVDFNAVIECCKEPDTCVSCQTAREHREERDRRQAQSTKPVVKGGPR